MTTGTKRESVRREAESGLEQWTTGCQQDIQIKISARVRGQNLRSRS